MKSIGQIMDELGFDPNSTSSSKAAFIKYLAKQAYNVDLQIPEIYQTVEESGEATLDSFLDRPSTTESNVESIFKKPKRTVSKNEEQLEFSLDNQRTDYKVAE